MFPIVHGPLTREEFLTWYQTMITAGRERRLPPFDAADRPRLASQESLDTISDWRRPPILEGKGRFALAAEDEDEERLDAEPIRIEVVGDATLDISGVPAYVVARERAQIIASGGPVTVWAYDDTSISASGDAFVFGFDRALVDAYYAGAALTDFARGKARGYSGISALGASRIGLCGRLSD